MNKFTAGPWTTDPSQSFYVKAPDGSVICNASTQANQGLIREAPELARALEAAKVALVKAHAWVTEITEATDGHALEMLATEHRRDTLLGALAAARDEAAAVLVNAVGEG